MLPASFSAYERRQAGDSRWPARTERGATHRQLASHSETPGGAWLVLALLFLGAPASASAPGLGSARNRLRSSKDALTRTPR
jgi:hypothetical protein